jgi:putative Mg2+ transporter-C (MgtC) family protein
MIVSAYGFSQAIEMPHFVLDPSCVAAQVVSGIGFLGGLDSVARAGREGPHYRRECLERGGYRLGMRGRPQFAAALATAIMLLILVGIKPLEDAYRSRVQSAVLRVTAERGSLDPDKLKKLLGIRGGQLRRIVTTPTEDDLEETRLHLARV